MKKKYTIFLSTLMILLSLLTLTSCSIKTKNTNNCSDVDASTDVSSLVVTDVYILIGNVSNSMVPDFSVIRSEVNNAMKAGGNYYVFFLDGAPKQNSQSGKFEQYKKTGKKAAEEFYSKRTEEFLSMLQSATPQADDTDILEGLMIVSDIMNSSISTNEKKLFIFSSGVSTSGYIDFSSDSKLLSTWDSSHIITGLKNAASLPIFKNVEINWFGIGYTEAPQQEISRKNIEKLKELWLQILNEESINEKFDKSIFKITTNRNHTEEEKKQLKKVKTVCFQEDEDLFGYFLEKEMGFLPGKATLQSKEKAIKTLKAFAKQINESKSEKFLIVGTTAHDDSRIKRLKLSKERAEVIKRILISNGISAKKLVSIGIGTEEIGLDGFIIDDLNKDGTLNDEAQKNRRIEIMNEDSSRAQAIIQGWEKWKLDNQEIYQEVSYLYENG